MKKIENTVVTESNTYELKQIAIALWRAKYIISFFTILSLLTSVLYALNTSDVYRSEILLAPAVEQNGFKLPGQLGGLANLAGINIGNNAGSDRTQIALETIKSRDFLFTFLNNNNLAIPIIAAKGWDKKNNKLLIDEEVFDIKNNKWIRKVSEPVEIIPTNQEVREEFLKKLVINQDKSTSLVKISFEFYSPTLSKTILDRLVVELNNNIREKDLKDARENIAYLTNELKLNENAEIRKLLYSLIEEQTKTVMLSNVKKEYVFKIVDSAYVPEKKIKPSRLLIIILSSLISFLISSMICIIIFYKKTN